MRIAELSRTTGVSVPTIKYYLRERLLPPGRPTARNQADYSTEHVRRLRLVRTMRDAGSLGIGAVRSVVEAIDDEGLSVHEVLGVAQRAVGPHGAPTSAATPEALRAREDADRFLAELGWRVAPDAPARRTLAEALLALRRARTDAAPTEFRPYAEAARRLAVQEFAEAPPATDRTAAVEWVIVGTVAHEAALIALRRLAEENESARRFGSRATEAVATSGRGRARRTPDRPASS
jgi:DNA-binding transcriptional MerR regulator